MVFMIQIIMCFILQTLLKNLCGLWSTSIESTCLCQWSRWSRPAYGIGHRCSVSVISRHTYFSVWPTSTHPVLRLSKSQLLPYSGEVIEVFGAIDVTTISGAQMRQLSVVVMPVDDPTLFGGYWVKVIHLNWRQLHPHAYSSS